MKSVLSKRFRERYKRLPFKVQRLAHKNYQLWKENPSHRSLQFKCVDVEMPIYSARIGLSYRVLGIMKEDVLIWYWIGTHSEYDKII